jgi:hypothetical protein
VRDSQNGELYDEEWKKEACPTTTLDNSSGI